MSEEQQTTSQAAPAQGGLSPVFIGMLVVGVFLVGIFGIIMLTQRDIAETAAPASISTLAQEGKELYLGIGNCNGCHPKEGRAAGIGPRVSTSSLSDETIFRYIRQGKGAMPANNALSDDQIRKIILYMREIKPK